MILVVHHVPATVLPAPPVWNTGVDLFFVLSGYLLGGICLEHRRSATYFSTFYARRAFRIFPIYFAWIAVYVLLGHHMAESPSYDRDVPAWPYALYVQNFYVAARGDVGLGPGFLSPTWSLAIEEHFYLVLPLLVWLLPVRWLPLALSMLICTAFASRVCVSLYCDNPVLVNYVFTFSRWDALFVGVLGAWAVRRWGLPKPRYLWPSLILLCILVSPLWTLRSFGVLAHIKPTLLALFYLALLLLALASATVSRWLRIRPLVFLGAISYGAYLFQNGILDMIRSALAIHVPEVCLITIAIVTTLTLAWLSYRFLESPLVRIGHRWKYASVTTSDADYFSTNDGNIVRCPTAAPPIASVSVR